ncbi:hypothetical protein [uncultured Muribaculum sp.]|jgi:putative peptide zinc metalloprotease protein|uniref:hypothetical protein n=1 Tax=uncultured Muribaculum sp. TaxID=1918613 RepID=UPI0025B1BD0C|nr:hypothetical protein [uncultured Muribaculum sp.]
MELFKNINITEFQSSTKEDVYLVVSDDNYFETNRLTAELLSALKAADSVDNGIERFLETHNFYTYEQIRAIVDETLVPKITQGNRWGKQFLYDRKLIPARIMDTVTDRLAFMFNKKLFFSLMGFGMVAIVCFFIFTDNLFRFGNQVDACTMVALLVFVVGSSMFHEIGHAAAVKHFGLRHGGIGFGLYLNFPVLYTDVSAAWQLPRRQRCVVNIAGVYFQIVILIGLVAVYFLTGNDVLRYMVLTMVLGFVLTLNPFFKFDGYWMMSDLLGVSNLRKKTQGMISHYFLRLFGKRSEGKSFLLQIGGKMRIAVIAYAVAVNVFMVYYFCYVIPLFVYGFVEKFPDELTKLIICLSNNIMPSMALLRNIVTQSLFMVLIGYMLYRVGYSVYSKKTKGSAE